MSTASTLHAKFNWISIIALWHTIKIKWRGCDQFDQYELQYALTDERI